MPSAIKKGLTTIFWGTKALTNGGTANPLASAIVESINYKPVVDVPNVDDGDGFTVTEVIVDNGFDAEVKCVFDSALTYPAVGDKVALLSPRFGSTVKDCLVVDITEEAARKKEAMITIGMHYRPGRTLP